MAATSVRDAEISTETGEHALDLLAASDLELARLLLEHGADATVRDPQNMTAADRAAQNAMFDVEALLRARE